MVTIDQLRISDDGKKMHLDVHVNEASYFSNVYLDEVTILTEDQVSELDPLSFGDDYIYQTTVSGSKKELHLVLDVNSFNENFTGKNMSDNMFFMYVKTKGTPAADTPCRLDETTTLGVTFDYGMIYNNALSFTRELADGCNIPMRFMDFILNYEALKLAIETEHYIVAVKHFRWLKGSDCGNNVVNCGCGCNG